MNVTLSALVNVYGCVPGRSMVTVATFDASVGPDGDVVELVLRGQRAVVDVRESAVRRERQRSVLGAVDERGRDRLVVRIVVIQNAERGDGQRAAEGLQRVVVVVRGRRGDVGVDLKIEEEIVQSGVGARR